jgi:hypothetical protein
MRDATSTFRRKKPQDMPTLPADIVVRFFVEEIKSEKSGCPGIQERMTNSETVMFANGAFQSLSGYVILIGLLVAHNP